MQRRIDLNDKQYLVTVTGHSGGPRLTIGTDDPLPASLTHQDQFRCSIRLGEHGADLDLAVKGETVYVRAFGRNHTLNIIDPVEQAAQASGKERNTARAPMPGMVVEIHVSEGEAVTKGQPMITIESMKILTVLAAPRDGEVARVHLGAGDAFEKNASLVTLKKKEEV